MGEISFIIDELEAMVLLIIDTKDYPQPNLHPKMTYHHPNQLNIVYF